MGAAQVLEVLASGACPAFVVLSGHFRWRNLLPSSDERAFEDEFLARVLRPLMALMNVILAVPFRDLSL